MNWDHHVVIVVVIQWIVNEEQSQDYFAVVSPDPAHSVLQNIHYVHSKHEKARPEKAIVLVILHCAAAPVAPAMLVDAVVNISDAPYGAES